MIKINILVLLCFTFSTNVFACSGGFGKGFGYSLEELVDKTESIVVVYFSESQDKGSKFNVIRTIKSPNNSSIDEELKRFYRLIGRGHQRHKSDHQSIDFDLHRSEDFWLNKKKAQNKMVTRVQWYGGMCIPTFTFKNNEKYLLFLDSPGSIYAAEILVREDDEWYQYVKKRVFN